MNTGTGSAPGSASLPANQSASKEGAHLVHQPQGGVGIRPGNLRERPVCLVVVREGRVPVAAIVMDLAEREMEIAPGFTIRGRMLGRCQDEGCVRIVLRGESLDFREVERGLGVSGVHRQSGAVAFARCAELPHCGVDGAEIVAKNRGVGIEIDRAECLRHRFLRPSLLDERASEPRSNLRIMRRESHRAAQTDLRTDDVAHVQQRMPEVEVRGDVAWIVGEGGFVARDGGSPLAPLLKQVAEAVVGDGDGRVPAKQATVQVDGEVGAAALSHDGGEQVQRVGLIANGVDHTPGELLRLAQVPGAVGVEGAPQPSIDVQIGAGPSRAARRAALSSPSHAPSARMFVGIVD